MGDAKELFRSMLKTSVHENTEDIQWETLEASEKRACLTNSFFDVDFVAISGLAQSIVADNMVQLLLANTSATFVKNPYVQRLHGYRLQKVLVICDLKPFKLAVSLNDALEEDESAIIQAEEENQENVVENCNFAKNVSDLLGMDKGRTFAFRDLKVKVQSAFEGFELVIFQFGQKQEIAHFLTHAEKIGPNVSMTVALALEVYLKDYLLMVTPENISVGECFFSMLLSHQAGSLLLGSKHASKIALNSKR